MMKINVRLYTLLRLKYKGYDVENGITILLTRESRLKDLINRFPFLDEDIAMIIVNGRLTKERDMVLKDGDIVEFISDILYGG